MKIPISDRARRFGYIFWTKALDAGVRNALGTQESVRLVFNGQDLGEKRIDWQRRRISIGQSRTRALPPTATHFDVSENRAGDDVRISVS